jgi:amylosucrase
LDDHIESGNGSIRKRIYKSTQKLIALRKSLPALAGQDMELIATANEHILGYVRVHEGDRLLVLANFAPTQQDIDGNKLRTAGLGRFFADKIAGQTYPTSERLVLEPYQILWLSRV